MHRTVLLPLMFVSGLLLLAGCDNTTKWMDVPVVKSASLQTPSDTTGNLFKTQKNNQASFRLERLIVALPRGQAIAHFPHRFHAKWQYTHFCNLHYGPNATLEWGSGRENFGDWSTEVGKIFYDVMRQRGTNVVGDTSALFQRANKVQSAEFLVGGRITDIRGNLCNLHAPLSNSPLDQYVGEFYVKVEWEVFSALRRRVIHKFQTEGYAKTTSPKQNGIVVTFFNAYSEAVERAAQDAGFLNVLSRKAETQVAGRTYGRLRISGKEPYRRPLNTHLEQVLEATVTLRHGTGHGSGFLISPDGYLLTNAHVVGGGKRVPVEFSNGLRVEGQVLRKSVRRDVALVKIPVSAEFILPLVPRERLAVSDDVYAIGSPAFAELKSTVTKGIVSAFRRNDRDRISYIQADVPVTGGNSGGPLVDRYGNVVGITVAGLNNANDINLFIPIDEALRVLNVTVDRD